MLVVPLLMAAAVAVAQVCDSSPQSLDLGGGALQAAHRRIGASVSVSHGVVAAGVEDDLSVGPGGFAIWDCRTGVCPRTPSSGLMTVAAADMGGRDSFRIGASVLLECSGDGERCTLFVSSKYNNSYNWVYFGCDAPSFVCDLAQPLKLQHPLVPFDVLAEFGHYASWGRFNNSNQTLIAVGAPGKTVNTWDNAGRIHVFLCELGVPPCGPGQVRAQSVTPATPNPQRNNEEFGKHLVWDAQSQFLISGADVDVAGQVVAGSVFFWDYRQGIKGGQPDFFIQPNAGDGTLLASGRFDSPAIADDGSGIVFVGMWRQTVQGQTMCGAVYAYDCSAELQSASGGCALLYNIDMPSAKQSSAFGQYLWVDGGVLVISSLVEDLNPAVLNTDDRGAVYAVNCSAAGGYDQCHNAPLKRFGHPAPMVDDRMGRAVALSRGMLAVGVVRRSGVTALGGEVLVWTCATFVPNFGGTTLPPPGDGGGGGGAAVLVGAGVGIAALVTVAVVCARRARSDKAPSGGGGGGEVEFSSRAAAPSSALASPSPSASSGFAAGGGGGGGDAYSAVDEMLTPASSAGEVGDWLRARGLATYIQAFASNNVTGDSLSRMKNADVKQLVLPIGDRTVVLSQAARLKQLRLNG